MLSSPRSWKTKSRSRKRSNTFNLLAIPVVDSGRQLVGIITHDDVIDVVREELAEDAHRIAAVAPLEDDYSANRSVDAFVETRIVVDHPFLRRIADRVRVGALRGRAGEIRLAGLLSAADYQCRR